MNDFNGTAKTYLFTACFLGGENNTIDSNIWNSYAPETSS